MSIEVDILPIADSNDETARLADLIEGAAGELSPFEEMHGFSIDGVDLETAVLPDGWRLDKEDLCAAKLVALREKDRNFVAALLKASLVDANLIASRLRTIPREHAAAGEAALTWLKASLNASGC